MVSANMLGTTTCAFARPAISARSITVKKSAVCTASKDSNATLVKLAGAAAAAQIALLPFAGHAVAQPLFDLAVDTPLAQSGKDKSSAEKAGNVELPGPAPSLGDAISATKDVASGGGGLKEAGRSGGRNISANRATGDISLGEGVGDVVKRVQQAGDILGTGSEVAKKGQDTAGAAGNVASVGNKLEGAAQGVSNATGDVSGVGDIVNKAQQAAPSPGDAKSVAGNVDLPGPAPSLGDAKDAVADVSGGGGGLKAAAQSGGANISRTGDAMPDGLKEGQYKPT